MEVSHNESDESEIAKAGSQTIICWFIHWYCCWCLVTKSCPTLCDPMDQTPLSMGFPRQVTWSGLPFPSPGDIPDPGIEPTSPARQVDSLPLRHQGSLHWDWAGTITGSLTRFILHQSVTLKALFYGWTNKCQDWGEALLELPLTQWFLQVDMHQKRPEGWLKYRLLGCTSRASYALGLGGTQEFAFFTKSRRCRCCWSRDHTWRAPHSKRKVWPTPKLSSVPRIAAASAVTINVLESF